MIKTATPEQWAQIDAIRERWLAEQTREVSYDDVVIAVHGLYKSLGKEKMPLVFQVDGPLDCAKAMVLLSNLVPMSLDGETTVFDTSLSDATHANLDLNVYTTLVQKLIGRFAHELTVKLGHKFKSEDISRKLDDDALHEIDQTLEKTLDNELDKSADLTLYVKTTSVLRSVLFAQLNQRLHKLLTGRDTTSDGQESLYQVDKLLYRQLGNQLSYDIHNNLYSSIVDVLVGQLSNGLDTILLDAVREDIQEDSTHSNVLATLSEQLYQLADYSLEGVRQDLQTKLEGVSEPVALAAKKIFDELTSDDLTIDLHRTICDEFYNKFYKNLNKTTTEDPAYTLLNRTRSWLVNLLTDQLSNLITNTLDKIMGEAKFKDSVKEQLKLVWPCLWWQTYAAYYEGAKVLGVQFDEDKYTTFRNWCIAVPACRATEDICIVSKWPVGVHWQDNVLHNESGPAVEFRDGFKVWSIGGVSVNEQIVMAPETQTLEQIESEDNEEVRRIRIERFGWLKYIERSGAETVNIRTNYVDGTEEKLVKLKDGSRRLLCVCRSTGRRYAIGVPEDIKTCKDAQDWMAGGCSFVKGDILGAS